MNLLFLGTSSGVPTRQRNVSGLALLGASKQWCLVDCGEATQHQILRTKLSLNKLSAILITHVHGDHCYGLPGLLSSASLAGREKPLTIVAPKAIQAYILQVAELTKMHLTFEIIFVPIEEVTAVEQIMTYWNINVCSLSHRVPSYGYVFQETEMPSRLNVDALEKAGIPPGPEWGKLQRGESVTRSDGTILSPESFLLPPAKGRKLIVCGDNDQPELLSDEAKNTDLLVHEATFTDDWIAKAGNTYGHSSAGQVARFAQAASIPNLILTHFSARYAGQKNDENGLTVVEDEARASYGGNLYLAKDFEEYKLNIHGELVLESQAD